MTNTPYESMSSTELDRELAEKLLGWKEVRGDHKYPEDMMTDSIKELYDNEWHNEWYGEGMVHSQYVYSQPESSHWNPTHPDSNQIDRYVFPKIMEHDFIIMEMGYHGPWWGIEISHYHLDIPRSARGDVSDMLVELEVKAGDDINRTKAIACLKANAALQTLERKMEDEPTDT